MMAKRSNGLFTKVEHPLPNTARSGCIVYGTAGAGVDLGVDADAFGTIFLSNLAIREAAEVAGFVVNEEGLQLEKDLAYAEQRVSELLTENEELKTQLDAVSLVFARAQAKK